jgi:hypothetical protein
MLARKERYYLSHASRPVCSGHFGDRVLLFALSFSPLRQGPENIPGQAGFKS